jgi:putative oxidoreductase
MIDLATAPYAALLLRWCFTIMYIAHALKKATDIKGEMVFFRSIGLPGWFVQLTITVELGGAACLALGIMPRYVALLLVPQMLGTIVTVHGKNGWEFGNRGGGWEYPAFWAAALLALFLLGDGPWTLLPSPSLAHLIAGSW